MKNFYLLIALVFFACSQSMATPGVGCVAPAPSVPSNPHVSPAPSAVPCIILGQTYNESLEIENISSFAAGSFGTVTMDSIIIDTIQNLPCGINYYINTSSGSNNKILGGGTACILLYGNTADAVGQYKLHIVLSVYLHGTVGGFPVPVKFEHQSTDQLAATLAAPPYNTTLPFDFNFYFKVSNCPTTCPASDTSASAINLTASCNVPFKANIAHTSCDAGCPGSIDTLKAITYNASGPTYQWLRYRAGVVTPFASGTPSVTVTAPDSVWLVTTSQSIADTTTFIVATLASPVAGLSVTGSDSVSVSFNNTSVGSHAIVFIIDSASGLVIDSVNGINHPVTHTFTANGTYYLQTISFNNCGVDTAQNQVVHITGIPNTGITEVNNINATVSLYPNPSIGQVNLKIYAATAATENYTVRIYNIQGQEVFTQPYIGNVNKAIDLGYLGAGVYLVHIKSTNLSTVQKMIIK